MHRPSRRTAALPLLLLALAGCGDEPKPQAQQTPAEPPPADAREREIRKARALDAVGYDGAGVERQLRKTIATQDAQQKRLEEAAKAAENP
jgi:hypothetical protein